MMLQQVFMTNMKKFRKEAALTQERLAELCNTDPGYIRQIELGRRFPSITYVERIAKALNVVPYRLFYNEIEQKQKIKTMLTENISRICSMIDELY